MLSTASSTAVWQRRRAISFNTLARHAGWLRIGLVLPFVLVCYQFDWTAWRSLACRALVEISRSLGLPVYRISPDTLLFENYTYQFVISCTALDAFFGSLPLLWHWGKSIQGNFLFLSVYFLCLSAVNLARLEVGLLLYAQGVPWWLSHEVVAGVFYFLLFLWVARQRGWTRVDRP